MPKPGEEIPVGDEQLAGVTRTRKKASKSSAETMRAVLPEFCNDIEAVGGVVKTTGQNYSHGNYTLAYDKDWVDLAETYVKACHALGRNPMVVER